MDSNVARLGGGAQKQETLMGTLRTMNQEIFNIKSRLEAIVNRCGFAIPADPQPATGVSGAAVRDTSFHEEMDSLQRQVGHLRSLVDQAERIA